MYTLDNHSVGDVLAEWAGPVTLRNYNVAAATNPPNPVVELWIRGTGGIKLQTCTTAAYISTTPGSTNAVGYYRGPRQNSSDWSDVGSEVTQRSGIVQATITPDDYRCWLRVICSTAGSGTTHWRRIWN